MPAGIKTGCANHGQGGITYMIRCFLHDWHQDYPRSHSTQTRSELVVSCQWTKFDAR
jgi:hypothetical protein